MRKTLGRGQTALAGLVACLLLGAGIGRAAEAPPSGAPHAPIAFVGVDVVPMTVETVLRNQTVVVRARP